MKDDRNGMCGEASLYALGGMDGKEREAMEEHLRHCPECRKEVDAMKEMVRYLPLSVEEVEPPAGMKSRILASVLRSDRAERPGEAASESEARELSHSDARSPAAPEADIDVPLRIDDRDPETAEAPRSANAERRRPSRRGRLVAALGIASVVLLAATGALGWRLSGLSDANGRLQAEVSELRSQLAAGDDPAVGLQVSSVIALKPSVRDLVAQGTAMIVIDSKGTHLVVQAEKLPELEGNEAFQVWLLKGGKPVNAGTFTTRDGSGALYYTFSPDDYDTIAITQEPDANGKEPRGRIVLAAALESQGAKA